jgi:Flp pilus assembly protein TadG
MKTRAPIVDMLVRGLKRLIRGESGQTMVIAAIFMGLVSIGLLALSIDVGLIYKKQRMAQAAADAAAMAAAVEVAANAGDQQSVANGVAKLNGFDTTLATNPATVTLSTPGSGTFTGGAYVQATVTQPLNTIFLGVFSTGMRSVTVGATSTAGGSNSSSTCVCLEGATGQDLNLSNNSKITANACGVVDNSSSSNAVGITGSATLTSLSLGTVSTNWNNSSNINNNGSIASSTKIVQGVPACSVTMPAAPTYSGCTADPGGSYGTFTWGPSTAGGTVCYNGLTIGANGATVTLNPGIYVIASGNLHFESGANNHSNLGGNGVFFYVASGSIIVDNGANINLIAGGLLEADGKTTAPSTGAYNGLLFYQPSSNTNGMNVAGGSTAVMNGSVYAPGAVYTLNNGSGTSISGGVVASGLTMAGGGTLNATSTTNEGSLNIASPRVVQ